MTVYAIAEKASFFYGAIHDVGLTVFLGGRYNQVSKCTISKE